MRPSNKPRQLLIWILPFLCFSLLAWRGYKNAHFGFRGDDSQLYLGVRQLFTEKTFYRNLDYVLIAPPGQSIEPAEHAIPNAYPPHTALFYLPFALFHWSVAHDLWLVFNLVCLTGIGVLLFRQFGSRMPRTALPLWLTAIFLSFPPYDIAFLGQISLPMLLALCLAWQQIPKQTFRADLLGGLFFSVAMIKPTLALPFLGYHLLRSDTRRMACCGVGFTVFFTLGVMLISGHPIEMLQEYRATVRQLTVSGDINDTGFTGPRRHSFTTLSVTYFDALAALSGHPHPQAVQTPAQERTVRILETLVLGTVIAVFLYAAWRMHSLPSTVTDQISRNVHFSVQDTWALSALGVASLCIFYHSWSDAAMLYLPLCVILTVHSGIMVQQPWRRYLSLLLLAFILFVRGFMVTKILVKLHLASSVLVAEDMRYTILRIGLFLLLILLMCELIFSVHSMQRPNASQHDKGVL